MNLFLIKTTEFRNFPLSM